ncbi:glycosyltransferase [Maribacter algarum]|uniref:Glycosyltransferase n=1 Tax=Maribacter algarum (ex Zhang et al. 2020) TaxID=2578118 RepID=A0A5S3PT70_9FLAO|nr:glycosyltransferase family 2 protein [Maribacter algarum]TMM58195.1 glycosyltransferase [Maribacter algarum]
MIDKNPLISIITVVYNGERYLQQTIDSVANQSYKNIEYIIVDGESTDATLSIIKKNSNHISQWISEPDEGLYDAMNKGIGMAKGVLIGIINSDDWYELNAVETVVNTYLEFPQKTIFHSNRFDVDNDTKKIRKFNPSNFKFKYYGMTYNHPSMFISPREYKEHLYNTTLKSLSDYEFILTAFLRDPDRFYYIDQTLVNYRLDGISAHMGFLESKKEAYLARRQAGMSILERVFAVIFGSLVRLFYPIFKFLK